MPKNIYFDFDILIFQAYSAPQKFHLQNAIKDGYESDSTLVFKRKENFTPRTQTPAEAKSVYSQIQRGGEIPVSGLRMSFPDKPKGRKISCYKHAHSVKMKRLKNCQLFTLWH